MSDVDVMHKLQEAAKASGIDTAIALAEKHSTCGDGYCACSKPWPCTVALAVADTLNIDLEAA